ncbi:MAG: NAD(P)-dependent oxidoreductase, partial [Bacteroidales bacterium]
GVYGPREKDYLMQIKVIKAGFALHAGFSPQYLTYCYVEDLVTVIFLAIEHGVVHKSYFLSDGEITTNAHFEEIAARILGKKKLFVIIIPLPIIKCVCFINEMLYTHILHRPTTINRDKYEILSARNWICGNDKVCKDLDFKPAFNLEKGLEKTIAWNQKQGTL